VCKIALRGRDNSARRRGDFAHAVGPLVWLTKRPSISSRWHRSSVGCAKSPCEGTTTCHDLWAILRTLSASRIGLSKTPQYRSDRTAKCPFFDVWCRCSDIAGCRERPAACAKSPSTPVAKLLLHAGDFAHPTDAAVFGRRSTSRHSSEV
jgi:hypothetical protein